ncbi:metallophosphoesterase [Gordonia sp. PP30]|uniref:metallophosphoesterase n=1 Tax=unclassified Gordonia (in: high G+C Gram-positive bacteria) TaxID=2657482 RepID=UPI001FFF4135|nr:MULTISPECIES: metallophosphoesterase [unclassified Gordonia (in: high G+C Gram-positive bacteria)]UQE74966.1 metallophosphoesterase [Gordonia sp. PP30]
MVVVAQISDLHFDGTAEHRDRVAAVLDYLDHTGRNGTPVSALLLSGDLTDQGTAAEYAELAANLVSDLPIVAVLGNHDDRAAYTAQFTGTPSIAPVNSALRLNDLLVLGLDSSIPGRAEGELSDGTLAWARREIAAAGDVDVLLTWHHPPVTIGMPTMDTRRLRNAADAAALVTEHPNVVGVVTGHVHTPAASVFAGRPLIVAPGVASTLNLPVEGAGWVNETQGPGLAFHVIDDHRLTSHFRTLSRW